jgi:hypothetical protein
MRRLIVLLAACASPTSGDSAATAPGPGVRDAPAEQTSGPAKTTPSALAPAPLGSAAASSSLGDGADWRSAARCSADADCGWDDLCSPTRCVAASPPTGCEKSFPPPGACLCVAGSCTLKPKVVPPASGSCEVRGCVVDRAGGMCVADTGGVPENIRSTPGVDVGPSCDCPNPNTILDLIPCRVPRGSRAERSSHAPTVRPLPLARQMASACSANTTAADSSRTVRVGAALTVQRALHPTSQGLCEERLGKGRGMAAALASSVPHRRD